MYMAKHSIELTAPDVWPNNAALNGAESISHEIEKGQIHTMLCLNVTEPAQWEWASSIVFSPSKEGSLRLCVDYKKLAAVTVKATCPILEVNKCSGSLDEASIF